MQTRRSLLTGAGAVAAYAALTSAGRAATAPAPYSAAGQSYGPQTLCCAHGGRINCFGSGYGSSGTKTAFKGRRPFYLPRGPRPTAIRFVMANHYRQAVTAQPEVAGAAPIVYRQVAIAIPSGFAPVTFSGGGLTIPVPPATATPGTLDAYTLSDWIYPSDLGLIEFPLGRFEFRCVGDYTATSAPISPATWRPGGGQGMRYAPANEGTLDVYAPSTQPMTYPSGYDSVPVFLPIMVIGYYPNGGSAVFGMGDSITYGQGDFQGLGDFGIGPMSQGTGGGGNWFERACFAAGIASFNAGVSGQAGAHYLANAAYQKQLYPLFSSATWFIGTNDFFSSNQANFSPNGAASALGALSQFSSDFKSATGGGRIAAATIPPRTSATNNQKYTTVADQTPDSGFVTGGFADTYNQAILASPQSYGCDFAMDLGAACKDTGTPTSWKVMNTATTTLAAAYASGATSATLTAAVAVAGGLVVMEAGSANVDTNSGIGAIGFSVSGVTVNFNVFDPYSQTTITWLPAIAHASGTAVAFGDTNDGIHPGPRLNAAMALAARSTLLQMSRKW